MNKLIKSNPPEWTESLFWLHCWHTMCKWILLWSNSPSDIKEHCKDLCKPLTGRIGCPAQDLFLWIDAALRPSAGPCPHWKFAFKLQHLHILMQWTRTSCWDTFWRNNTSTCVFQEQHWKTFPMTFFNPLVFSTAFSLSCEITLSLVLYFVCYLVFQPIGVSGCRHDSWVKG